MVGQTADEHPLLHIISVLDWTREGKQTFDQQRAELLHLLAWILQQMDPSQAGHTTLDYVLLGGQTILLEDIAAIRTSLHTSLVISNAGGRIGLGPFYVGMDGMQADGEALIRNLLLGRADVQRHGIRLMNIAYLPEERQQSAQMPQILRGFGIDAALISSLQPVTPLPFQWRGLDDSAVLAVNYTHQPGLIDAVEMQRKAQPDGPFLWMNRLYPPVSHHLNELAEQEGFSAHQSMVDEFIMAVRDSFPDELRPRFTGELQLEKTPSGAHRYSARINQKQDATRLLHSLLHSAEPLLALAITFARTAGIEVEIERALLDQAWRLTLQNQTRLISAGAISDATANEVTIRSRRAADLVRHVEETAFNWLPGKPITIERPAIRGETWLMVWNPHGHTVRQVVEVPLHLPDEVHPHVLLSPTQEELAFSWHPQTQRISFRADVPPVGYAVYTLKLSKEETAEYNLPQTAPGSTIGSASGESLGIFAGRIDWSFDGDTLSDLLSYQDGGDAGNVWQYMRPQTDMLITDSIVDVAQTELTPTYERLTYRSRMRLAPGLKDGMIRERGLRVLDLATTFTYFHELPGIHVRTHFSNPADDHRLRALIRTGIDAEHVYNDGAFIVNRSTRATGIQPAHSLIAVEDHTRSFAVFTRGLSEFEALYDSTQTTIALTLLRAVRWIDQQHKVAAAGAQMPGDHTAEFMLLPLANRVNRAELLRTAQSWRAPLRVVQSSEKPPQMSHSYVTLEGDTVVLTALKPPQEGAGLIVRVLNISEQAAQFRLHSPGLKRAVLTNLAEEGQEEYPVVQHAVEVQAKPHQIVTLQLLYR